MIDGIVKYHNKLTFEKFVEDIQKTNEGERGYLQKFLTDFKDNLAVEKSDFYSLARRISGTDLNSRVIKNLSQKTDRALRQLDKNSCEEDCEDLSEICQKIIDFYSWLK